MATRLRERNAQHRTYHHSLLLVLIIIFILLFCHPKNQQKPTLASQPEPDNIQQDIKFEDEIMIVHPTTVYFGKHNSDSHAGLVTDDDENNCTRCEQEDSRGKAKSGHYHKDDENAKKQMTIEQLKMDAWLTSNGSFVFPTPYRVEVSEDVMDNAVTAFKPLQAMIGPKILMSHNANEAGSGSVEPAVFRTAVRHLDEPCATDGQESGIGEQGIAGMGVSSHPTHI
ncbi:hypothetical protein BLNAU_12460 [Blattamonas nauphoetae]|uniref:Uncharacterized protein n=1 Tax=Blattamonas nauphoetae TaxID=2049346 RepID=A0ABQ9XPT5_9EUKA|nr:hypothetical protein BLNAU_12460 [Blattamonas nauphoetae]